MGMLYIVYRIKNHSHLFLLELLHKPISLGKSTHDSIPSKPWLSGTSSSSVNAVMCELYNVIYRPAQSSARDISPLDREITDLLHKVSHSPLISSIRL